MGPDGAHLNHDGRRYRQRPHQPASPLLADPRARGCAGHRDRGRGRARRRPGRRREQHGRLVPPADPPPPTPKNTPAAASPPASPSTSGSASASASPEADPTPSPIVNKAVKAAIHDDFPALVPAGVPAGWTVVSAAYDGKAHTWRIDLTDPSGGEVVLVQAEVPVEQLV